MSPARAPGVSAYIAVTAAYWAFELTDGALRMLVLLHFNGLGFSPIQLAWLFLLYEVAGIVTNLSAGWIAARFGLTTTLYAGLGLQIVALVALAQLDPAWSVAASVGFVMAVQGASGVAKDLAKMSAKSAVKVLAPGTEGGLFRWVAALTGSKNAVKGAGFFLGAALLGAFGFAPSLWGMAGVLALVLLAVALSMPPGLPRGRKGAKFAEVFSKDARINRLSLARMFLFGARDVWFVVGIPVYFTAVLSDGTPAGQRAAFFLVGGFMALWIIAYGAVQASAPKLLRAKGKPVAADHRVCGALGGRTDRDPPCARRRVAGWPVARPLWLTITLVARAAGLRLRLRDQLLAAFLPDPRLQQRGAGDDGCRLLLHGQCGGAADRHAAVRASATRPAACRSASPRPAPWRR